LVWVLGILFTLVRGNWMMVNGWEYVDLDFLSIVIGYLFLAYGQTAAGVFAFGQGLTADLVSAGLEGISTAVYLAVFGTVYLGCRFFNLEEPKGQMIIVSSSILVKKGLFLGLLSFFSMNVAIPKGTILVILSSGLLTGLATPIVFYLLGRVRGMLSRERPRGTEVP
jgi:cell shape-determining protein MreD